MKTALLSIFTAFIAITAMAQNNFNHCASGVIRNQMIANDPAFKLANDQIEQFTQDYIKRLENGKQERSTIYRIPVVVHIVHNGEAIGSGANISASQVLSQIAVLNKDYRLKNSDSLATSHAYHQYVADCEIEFCLATLDPTGNLTSGIDRYNGGQATYDYPELENNIKPNTIWDHERYLNIWVCKLGGTAATLLGYATPPGTATDNDGVVIGTTNFGTVGNLTAAYNKGRTATHEIGHFFNLIHIWGDDGTACTGSDQVSDTPNQAGENYGCPTFPKVTCSNGPNGDMFMNYMDYSDDGCMKMFTAGQKARMRATLISGGSRSTLTVSNGCTWPVGLTEVQKDPTFSLFPNPSSDHFYLKSSADFSADFSIRLFNVLGQEFTSGMTLDKEAGNRYYINTGSLANGTYILKINSDSKTISKQLTIIK